MNYREAIKKMLKTGECRLIVNLDDLRSYNREFCDGYGYSASQPNSHASQPPQGPFKLSAGGGPRPHGLRQERA